jgi:hypothetical protein
VVAERSGDTAFRRDLTQESLDPSLSGPHFTPAPPNEIAESPYDAVSSERLITEWNIQSRGHGCEVCARQFADKESYYTLLVEEKSGFRRSDICATCWPAKFAEAQSVPGLFSHWQGVYEAPPPVTEAIQKDTAETLLRKLIEQNDPQHAPAAYILAVMLERKRILKVKEQLKRDGQRIFIYEHPKTGDIFTIADPDLRLDQLEVVQRDVAALLEHGLNPSAAQPAENAAPAKPEAAPTESAEASEAVETKAD